MVYRHSQHLPCWDAEHGSNFDKNSGCKWRRNQLGDSSTDSGTPHASNKSCVLPFNLRFIRYRPLNSNELCSKTNTSSVRLLLQQKSVDRRQIFKTCTWHAQRPEIILLPTGKTGIRGTELSQHESLHHIAHLAENLNAERTNRFSARSQFTHQWLSWQNSAFLF
jgi:hypothetical protein